MDGKLSTCQLTWDNGVVIVSNEAKLTVRAIKAPPVALSMAVGANATLSCTATGKDTAEISFLDKDTQKPLPGENSTKIDSDDHGRVITIGTFIPGIKTSTNVVCAVKWYDDPTVLQTESVLVAVVSVDIQSNDTTDGWVTQGSGLEIKCLSDVLTSDGNGGIFPEANFHWTMLFDSKWIDVDGNKAIR